MTSDTHSFTNVIPPLPQPPPPGLYVSCAVLFQSLHFNMCSSDSSSFPIFIHILVLALIAHRAAGIEGLPPLWEDSATLPCYISNPFLRWRSQSSCLFVPFVPQGKSVINMDSPSASSTFGFLP